MPSQLYKKLIRLKDNYLLLIKKNPSFSVKEKKSQDDLFNMLTTIIEQQQKQLDSLHGDSR